MRDEPNDFLVLLFRDGWQCYCHSTYYESTTYLSTFQDEANIVQWADAHLDPKGITQAQKAADYWLSRIQLQNIPPPQSYYTSPLYRCLQTSNITFSTLPLPKSRPFKPLVKELLREGISGHTCDRRSNRTFIHESFPSYKIEKGFAENDPFWKALEGEVSTDQDIRSKKVLDDIFGSDDHTWLSITSHSGEIASILRGMISPFVLLIFRPCLWLFPVRQHIHDIFPVST